MSNLKENLWLLQYRRRIESLFHKLEQLRSRGTAPDINIGEIISVLKGSVREIQNLQLKLNTNVIESPKQEADLVLNDTDQKLGIGTTSPDSVITPKAPQPPKVKPNVVGKKR